MNITKLVVEDAMKKLTEMISEVQVLHLEPTNLILASDEVILSEKILALGGKIEDWDNDRGEFYLYFPSKEFEAGIIKKLDDLTYFLISFGDDQHIITISKKEVEEIMFHEIPAEIRDALLCHGFDEIRLTLP